MWSQDDAISKYNVEMKRFTKHQGFGWLQNTPEHVHHQTFRLQIVFIWLLFVLRLAVANIPPHAKYKHQFHILLDALHSIWEHSNDEEITVSFMKGVVEDNNMTVWILAGNYISFTIAAGLIRLHMPGVKKSRV